MLIIYEDLSNFTSQRNELYTLHMKNNKLTNPTKLLF